MLKPCITCGTLSEGARCAEHQLPDVRGTASARGYDAAWHRLSKRARKLQPWCSDCYTTVDLTVDHTPEAWARKLAGKPIRLRDVDVVCRPCNAKRGRARPPATGNLAVTRGENPPKDALRPSVQAKFASYWESFPTREG